MQGVHSDFSVQMPDGEVFKATELPTYGQDSFWVNACMSAGIKGEVFTQLHNLLFGNELVLTSSGSTGPPKEIRLPYSSVTSIWAKAQVASLGNPDGGYLMALSPNKAGGGMALVRAMIMGKTLVVREMSAVPLREGDRFGIVSLVPYQVQACLSDPVCKEILLNNCEVILLGGADSSGVMASLSAARGRIYSGFGMTETGGFFALKELNHLKVKDNQAYRLIDGWELGTQLEGPLEVYNAETNTLVRSTDVIQVAVGEPDDAFTWLGRSDFVINTGGVKIHPETIENYLEWLANKVVISSIPDVKLSEAVVAVVESSASEGEIQLLQDADFLAIIREKAANHSAYARPRKLFAIRAFPRVANGKVDRLALTKALQAWHKKTFPFGY